VDIRSLAIAGAVVASTVGATPTLRPTQVSGSDCVAPRILLGGSSVSIFTDRCSESDFFVGLNGITHQLHRVGSAPTSNVTYLGRFAGGGITVEIRTAGRALAACEFDPSVRPQPVSISVRRGNRAVNVRGIYDPCP